jgi:hypothetical protein
MAAAALEFAPVAMVSAQCPDGSLPTAGQSCDRPVARTLSLPIDPNRVAVLPFRITTADSLLGEGFAELLAPEFTGEGGPRSVNMSTTLNAWRRAGGGLRTPLTQDAAIRLGRELGAGLLAHGSVVGLGGRLRITAALYNTTTGRAVGTEVRAVGPADSIETLLQQVATGLLGNAGATARAREAAGLTSVPGALRSYLEGLALWRRGRWAAAERAFKQSVAADSMFGLATYKLWILTSQELRGETWARRIRSLKSNLPPRERTVVETVLESGARGRAATMEERRAVAQRQADSPESWFFYGDYVYHTAHPVIGEDSAQALALNAFGRALAIDTQPVFLYHAMEIALHRRDTTLLRRLWRGYRTFEGEDAWPKGWVAASVLRDASMLSRLRQVGPDSSATFFSVLSLGYMLDASVTAALVDEGFRRLNAKLSGEMLEVSKEMQWLVHRAHGRPGAGERARAGSTRSLFRFPVIPWMWVTGDVDADEALLRERGPTVLVDSIAEPRRQCAWAQVHAARGRMDSAMAATRAPRFPGRCGRFVQAWVGLANGTLTDSAVATLDSLARTYGFGNFLGFEHRVMARIYESRGDTAMALRAIRRYPRDYPGVWIGPTRREEGRLALIAGDTVGARRAYEHYLELRAEAEPPLVAERDSVRALVAKLRR